MSSSNKLSVAVRAALGLGVSLAALSAAPAIAQDNSADESFEEIVVTGSRIKRNDLESASPVTVVTRADMVATGMTDVGDLIQRMPAASGSPIGTTTNNGGNGGVYVDLRGLGVSRTLNLINGKRTVDGGDYQAIPSVMIERVEILKDGASTVYGADAVAGVVNVITRSDFEGVEITAQRSDSFEADAGKQDTLSIIAGTSFDDGHFVFGLEAVDQEAAYQGDYPWYHFQFPYVVYPSADCLNGDGIPTEACYPWGSSRIPEGRIRTSDGDTFMVEDAMAGLVGYDGRSYNYNPVNYMQTPYSKLNIFSEARFNVNKTTEVYAEFRATHRESAQELAPMPYDSRFDPAYVVDPATGTEGVSRYNYYWNGMYQQAVADGTVTNPVTPDIVDMRRRVVETTRRFEQEVTQMQFSFGATGELGFKDWTYDSFLGMGFRQSDDTDYGQFFGPYLRNALGPSADVDGDGVPECLLDINDYSSVIAGCVPMNMTGGAGTITPEMLAYVSTPLSDFQNSKQIQSGVSVAGTAFSLPAGDVQVALGVDYRKEEYTYAPDSAKVMEEATGNVGAGTDGEYDVTSVYMESLIPVYDNGTQNVNVEFGLRNDNYSTSGSESIYSLKIDAQIIEDLRFRMTTGEVFRAPGIGSLFAGMVDGYPTYADPCDPTNNENGMAAQYCPMDSAQDDTQVRARSGGNPNLRPETGNTLTAGLVWSPTFADVDMNFTIDYWEVDLTDVISGYGAQQILNKCYEEGEQWACDLIVRRQDDAYSIDYINTVSLNLSEMAASGVDFQWDGTTEVGPGSLRGSVLLSHQISNERRAEPGASTDDLVGMFNGSTYAEDKVNYSVGYDWNSFSVTYMGEYISGTESPWYFLDGNQQIDAQLYHDITATYTFEETDTRIAFGLSNITNEFPPFIEDGFNGSTDPSAYRVSGRSYYLRVTQSF